MVPIKYTFLDQSSLNTQNFNESERVFDRKAILKNFIFVKIKHYANFIYKVLTLTLDRYN